LNDLYERLAKYDIVDVPINVEIAKRAISYFTDKISECHILRDDDTFNEISKSSAIGTGAKAAGIYSRKDPLLQEYLSQYVKVSGQWPQHVIINASQKDEVRVKGKSPRLFTSFPVEHTYLCTKVLKEFVDQFYQRRFCNDGSISAVGDPMQNGALAIYKYELSKREFLYCTDTSGQDSSVSRDFMNLVYDAIKTKYPDMNDFENNLFESVRFNSIDKMVNCNGDFYLVPRGLGSGDYLTVIINIMWRFYMILANYKYPLEEYFEHNTTIINGDDLIMSSDYGDLDLNSVHAKIEWAGKPVTWSEMDFCSTLFEPYIHHNEEKVLAVLGLRDKRSHMLSPKMKLQKLGGMLRTLSTPFTYNKILAMMEKIRDDHNLFELFEQCYSSYDEIYDSYNCPIYYT
jgi:hypothetical protein